MTYSPLRHIDSILWKNHPIHLTAFLTRRCNLRCPYCFYLQDRNISDIKHNELAPHEIEKISASLGKLLWLAFSGGEIFLRDDIAEITRIFYARNKPAVILFPTNGLLTDNIVEGMEDILKACSRSIITVKLSLDGIEKVHDEIRGAEGSFRRTLLTYRELAKFVDRFPNFELGINTVFSSENQDHIDDLIAFVRGLKKIRTHTVSLIRGDIPDRHLKQVDTHKYLETIRKIESDLKEKKAAIYRFRGAKLKAAQDIIQRRLIHKTVLKQKRLLPCYAGRLNLVVTETGDLYPCETFHLKLGNVKEYDYNIPKVLKSRKARRVTDVIRKNGCYCTNECYFMTNILFNPMQYPALVKEYLQL